MANVRTIRGTELPRARCAKIKGDFYEIGVDCHVRDGIYFRTDEAKRLAQQQSSVKEERPITPQTPPTPPTPPEELWKFSILHNTFTFTHGRSSHAIELSIEPSSNSCGTSQVSGISEFEHLIVESGVSEEAIKAALLSWLKTSKKENNKAFYIFSNNDETENINEIMDEIAHVKTDWKENPNSGNTIRIWVVD